MLSLTHTLWQLGTKLWLVLIGILLALYGVSPAVNPSSYELSYVAAYNGNADIYRLDVTRNLTINLTRHPGNDTDPAWSPDGRQIAFYAHRDQRTDLYVMKADGRDVQRVTASGGPNAYPVWSPDGQWIAYATAHQQDAGVYIVHPDGTGFRRLTDFLAVFIAWSPDGEHILFVAACESNCDLYVMKADGSQQRRLTRNGSVDAYPVWSPDSRHIAFISNRSLSFDLYLLDIQCDDTAFGGCSPERLTENRASDSFPDWSPDGTHIAFASDRTGSYEIHRVATACYRQAGGCQEQTTLLTQRAGTDIVPLWSPHTPHIAFLAAARSTFDIYIMDTDGNHVRLLQRGVPRDQTMLWRP